MSNESAVDRLAAAWQVVLDSFLGRKAAKTVDACAMYWGRVVKVSGAKVDVQLDSPDIASPSAVPLYLGFPGSTVTLSGGERVLVGFRNGDPTQPYAIAFEQSSTFTQIQIGTSSPQPAAREGDPLSASSSMSTWAGAVESALSSAMSPIDPTKTFALTAGIAGEFGDVYRGSTHVKIGG